MCILSLFVLLSSSFISNLKLDKREHYPVFALAHVQFWCWEVCVHSERQVYNKIKSFVCRPRENVSSVIFTLLVIQVKMQILSVLLQVRILLKHRLKRHESIVCSTLR